MYINKEQRCGVVWCGVVWRGVAWGGVVWCGVVWCGVVWCGVVWCGVVWWGVCVCVCMYVYVYVFPHILYTHFFPVVFSFVSGIPGQISRQVHHVLFFGPFF